MRPQELIRLIAMNAYASYLNTLVNHQAPRVARLYEELSNPQPGDLVLEISRPYFMLAASFPGRYDAELEEAAYLGRLISITKEPPIDAEEWDEAYEGRPVPLEKYWNLERLIDGVPQRWYNARFIKVLEQQGPNL